MTADAVRLRMRADVPYGAFLSGGVDSSTVVAFMSRCAEDPVRTFGIGFEDRRFDESEYSRLAARRFGTRHRQREESQEMLESGPSVLYHCDQPHGDVSFLPTLRVAQLAAEDVTVVLTGDGGDELFAGYDKYRDFFAGPHDGLDERGFRTAYADTLALFSHEERGALYAADSPFSAVSGETNQDVLDPLFDASAGFDRINRALHVDMTLLLPGNNLVKPDRMGMAVSLEARTPLLDYRVMEFAFRTPGSAKLQDGETKFAFKRAVTPLIGADLAYRAKQMFTVPIGEWFRGRLAGAMAGILRSERARERGLFVPEVVDAMIDAHVEGRQNRTRELRALLALELWFRVFIDRSWTGAPEPREILAPSEAIP